MKHIANIILFLLVRFLSVGQIVVGDDDLSALCECRHYEGVTEDEVEDDYYPPDFKAGLLYYKILNQYNDSWVEVYPPCCHCDSDVNYSQLDTCIIPEQIIYSGKSYVVRGIGWAAFMNCSKLKKVVLPNTITYIGPDAFHSCDSITSINIPESVKRVSPPNYWMNPYVFNVFQQLPDSLKYRNPHMVIIP